MGNVGIAVHKGLEGGDCEVAGGIFRHRIEAWIVEMTTP